MSTHNIPFFNKKKKITLNYPKSAAMGFLQGTQEGVKNSCGKQAISVRATVKFCCNQYVLCRLI